MQEFLHAVFHLPLSFSSLSLSLSLFRAIFISRGVAVFLLPFSEWEVFNHLQAYDLHRCTAVSACVLLTFGFDPHFLWLFPFHFVQFCSDSSSVCICVLFPLLILHFHRWNWYLLFVFGIFSIAFVVNVA